MMELRLFLFYLIIIDSSKVNLLFTDGLNTLSDIDIQFNKKTFIINSATSANHIDLKNITRNTGGDYLIINQKSFLQFTEEQLQFLGTNFSESALEVYLKKGTFVTEKFSISGKGDITNKNLELKFGYGNTILETVSFKLKHKKYIDTIVAKIWAQKKLAFLLKKKRMKQRL